MTAARVGINAVNVTPYGKRDIGLGQRSRSLRMYRLVDEELIQSCESSGERERYLFLEPSQEFSGFWKVNSFNSTYFFDLREIIGSYRVVAPADLERFLEKATADGYRVAFFEDPVGMLDAYKALNEPPPFAINSTFEETIDGFLPFQLQGFNLLKDVRGGIARWSTGTGKSVLASALIKYRLNQGDTDFIFFVAKAHNKTNVQRALKRFTDIDSVVIEGTKKRRESCYTEILTNGVAPIVVVNYEKFRDDHDLLLPLFDQTRIQLIWDEMPTKLRSRTSALYQGVCKALYVTKKERKGTTRLVSAITRPQALQQVMLSATPIEQSPADLYNCTRILDPGIYGTVEEFENEYVAYYNYFDPHKPEKWHRLDKMGMKVTHVMHQADKSNPEIAKYFPEQLPVPTYIDWDPKHKRLYDMLAQKTIEYGLDEINPLAAITVLQMICDAPTLLLNSATVYAAWEDAVEEWMDDGGEGAEPTRRGSLAALELILRLKEAPSNEGHTKLAKLHEILTEKHPNEKVCIYSSLKTGLVTPAQGQRGILDQQLDDWGIPHVVYRGTEKQRQTAQDAFMEDPKIRVFLSSDMGSDSLDLYAGSVTVDYDLPWKWSTKIQRWNRVHRAGSKHKTTTHYSLMMADSVDERRAEIIEQKKAYHEGVFGGGAAAPSMSARMSRADLLYILSGKR